MGYSGQSFVDTHDSIDANASTMSVNGNTQRDTVSVKTLPTDRIGRYKIYQEMSEDSTINSAIEQHLGYALSRDSETGLALYLEAKDPKDQPAIDILNKEVMTKINDGIMSWSYPTAIFGVNYVRPHVEEGKGIIGFESNYYTLPSQIREYERAGNLAGFTSESLKKRSNGEAVRLAEAWALVAIKIPLWHPNMNQEPVNYSGEHYSLYDDIYWKTPIETQNYGTSLLHGCYESYQNLRNSMQSLLASRRNASIIDRFISVSTDNLDSARAAEYINLVSNQLKNDQFLAEQKMNKTGVSPTIWNRIIPVMNGGAKQGINIDVQTTSPDIQHIEDIMFHIKRLCGSLGIDYSMLGWGDQMSGGLGDGGFFRTAIQAALRANLIRTAVTHFAMRCIDIHTIYRDGKVWTEGNEPYVVRFNSLNTAIEQEQLTNKENSANYATLVASVLEGIEQGALASSNSAKTYIYQSLLGIDPAVSEKIIEELAKSVSTDQSMMESLNLKQNNKQEFENYIKNTILDVIAEFNEIN